MTKPTTIPKLPNETLHLIFSLLPLGDLKTSLLVCRWWREVGEVPGLWTWTLLEVTEDNLAFMPEVLGFHRLKTLAKLSVSAWSEELLESINKHQGLKELKLRKLFLQSVTHNWFRIVAKLEVLYIQRSVMPSHILRKV